MKKLRVVVEVTDSDFEILQSGDLEDFEESCSSVVLSVCRALLSRDRIRAVVDRTDVARPVLYLLSGNFEVLE
jgi:hypothetical protein